MKYTLWLATIFCFVLVSCTSSAQAPASTTPQAFQPIAIATALFEVIKLDGSHLGITIADLKTLSLAQVSVEGRIEEGPNLLDVLAFAGVTEFSEISLTGSSNPATLTRDQVDNKTILDFTNHGTVKLATTYIPKPDWTKDISRIEVIK
jgi:hypothetical protein